MPHIEVGGQAVIEGVMMRSPQRVSTAVRKLSGEIVVKNEDYVSLTKRKKLLGVPIIRGVVSFFEMLVIGIKSLNFSADIAMEEIEKTEEKKKPKKKSASHNLTLALTVVFAFGLGIVLFFFLPLLLSSLLGTKKDALAFNLVAGAIRVTIFLLYLWGISLFKEFRKIFEYHGAEHMSIYTFETGEELKLDNVRKYSTKHPRCGTSFILIVAVFAIFFYSVSDTIYYLITGVPPILWKRLVMHFLLLPLVAGGSYELLKLSGKTKDNKLTQILIAPGLWLQRITTKSPNDSQIEVALVALQNALKKNEG